MDNAMQMTRRTTIRHLEPDTNYMIRVTANNAAGSMSRMYSFVTQPQQGQLTDRGGPTTASFIMQPHVMLTVVVVVVLLVIAVLAISIAARRSKSLNFDEFSSS